MQHWMSAAPGQYPATLKPLQDDVDTQVPEPSGVVQEALLSCRVLPPECWAKAREVRERREMIENERIVIDLHLFTTNERFLQKSVIFE